MATTRAGDPDDASRWGRTRRFRPDDPHVLGPPDAPVGIVVWADFCCPYCAAAAPVLSDLATDGTGRFALSFRHFPRSDVHPTAPDAHVLSEAAHERGSFWPMHDLLFSHGGRLPLDVIDACADELGVRARPHGRDGARLRERVGRDHDAGVAAGTLATPSIHLAGTAFTGEVSREALVAAADRLR